VRGTHQSDAAFPELIIAAVLVAGSVAVFRFPDRARRAALAASWFAVAGVMLGLSITAGGDGPAKAPNVAYHVCLLAILVARLAALLRDSPRPR
jgi:multisubunit Na+/H+ antiporter MnhG subunit